MLPGIARPFKMAGQVSLKPVKAHGLGSLSGNFYGQVPIGPAG